MKTRREARIWVYRDLTAYSLRKMAAKPGEIQKIHKGTLTDAQVGRAQAEMLRLAEWLEGKAAKLGAAPEEHPVIKDVKAALS